MTGSFPRIAIASRNVHKIREITRICADWGVVWVTVSSDSGGSGEWPDVEETGPSYLDNAVLKARAVARHTGIPALADDSGIEVDALAGAPGPRSARFAGEAASDADNLHKLIRSIEGVPAELRAARYRCVAVLTHPDGTEIAAEGTCQGSLVTEPRGTGGFGYDPVFVPDRSSLTMAELTDEEKDTISHRGRALRALRGAAVGR